MAVTLPSVVGHKEKKTQEENVANKDNVLQIKENARMKRKAMIQAQFNKFQKQMA
jgi:galactokinase/mevalonate kinase-like predicted kinase